MGPTDLRCRVDRLASSARGNEHGLIERAYAAWWRGRVGSVDGGGTGTAAEDDAGAPATSSRPATPAAT